MRQLLTELGPKVHRFGLKLCSSTADAEDATQETLLHLSTQLADFQGRSTLSSYAYAVVRSACQRKRRGLKNHPHEELDEALPDTEGTPEQRAAQRELSRKVEQALDGLPEEYREVLWLRDAEGLTAAETADALGASVGAVKSRLHRARKALKDVLHPVLKPDGAARGCPDVVEQLSRKLEGDLSEDACAEMQRHLEGCSECDHACQALRQALSVCRESSAGPAPDCVRRAVETALENYREASGA